MASLTIKTNLLNVTDSQSSTTSVSLDGAPFSTSDIITSRTFTSKANTSFTVKPYIDFTTTFFIAMSHQIFLVSFGAFTILMYLIKIILKE